MRKHVSQYHGTFLECRHDLIPFFGKQVRRSVICLGLSHHRTAIINFERTFEYFTLNIWNSNNFKIIKYRNRHGGSIVSSYQSVMWLNHQFVFLMHKHNTGMVLIWIVLLNQGQIILRKDFHEWSRKGWNCSSDK